MLHCWMHIKPKFWLKCSGNKIRYTELTQIYVCVSYSVDWMKLNEMKFNEQTLASIDHVCTHDAPGITEV